jgi:hypothetical protein
VGEYEETVYRGGIEARLAYHTVPSVGDMRVEKDSDLGNKSPENTLRFEPGPSRVVAV